MMVPFIISIILRMGVILLIIGCSQAVSVALGWPFWATFLSGFVLYLFVWRSARSLRATGPILQAAAFLTFVVSWLSLTDAGTSVNLFGFAVPFDRRTIVGLSCGVAGLWIAQIVLVQKIFGRAPQPT